MDLRSLASGVLWIDLDTSVDELLAGLGDDWVIGRVQVDPAATKTSIIDGLASALDFPSWAGRNLDALYDLLTDLDWLGERHVVVAVERTQQARAGAVDGWQQIVQVLTDAAAWWQPEPRRLIAVIG